VFAYSIDERKKIARVHPSLFSSPDKRDKRAYPRKKNGKMRATLRNDIKHICDA
jgi:hypothetical protein